MNTVTKEDIEEVIESGNGDKLREILLEALGGLDAGAEALPTEDELLLNSLLDLQAGLVESDKEVFMEAIAMAQDVKDINEQLGQNVALANVRANLA